MSAVMRSFRSSRLGISLGGRNSRLFSSSVAEPSPRVVVVGGGAGGLAVVSSFRRNLSPKQVWLVDPADQHYYQPCFTLVGGGLYEQRDAMRNMTQVVPLGIHYKRVGAESFDPENNRITTTTGETIHYDYLVVATGFQLQWDAIKGLKEAIGKEGVCTNYDYRQAPKTYEFIKATTRGTALFTMPQKPIKCPGAPQKIMYIADDIWRNETKTRDDISIKWMTGLGVQFAVKCYADSLIKLCDEKGIERNYGYDLTEIDAVNKEVTFNVLLGDKKGTTVKSKYDFLHVTPHQGPCEEVASSKLANSAGFVDVDKHTLQHVKYPNVFSLGDCSSVPTSRTAAAAAVQSGVVVQNIKNLIAGQPLEGSYSGYASCPLVCSRDEVILAEFNAFTATPLETFPFDQSLPRKSMFALKRYVLPSLYWEGHLRGLWRGPSLIRKALTYLQPPAKPKIVS